PITLRVVTHIVRDSAATKYSRFVHIVPKSGDTILDQSFIQCSPPFPNFGIGIIRELTTTRPYKAFHEVIVAPAAKVFVVLPLFEHPIIRIHLYPRIDHYYGFKTIGSQITYHLARIGKILLIPGKATVSVHIVDMQVQGITRDFAFPTFIGYITQFFLGIITPAALMVPQSTGLRQI